MMHRVSVTSLIAFVVTNNGCITFFVHMSLMHPSFTSMPARTLPSVWAFLNLVMILMGFNVGDNAKGPRLANARPIKKLELRVDVEVHVVSPNRINEHQIKWWADVHGAREYTRLCDYCVNP